MRWSPPDTVGRAARHLAAGDLIAYAFGAWRVLAVEQGGEKLRVEVELQHGEGGGKHAVMTLGQFGRLRIYRNPRIPLCSCCDNPYPCRTQEAERVAKNAATLMQERMERAAIPGTCYACGEPITTRQESITYPPEEGNVQLIGYPSPRFHTRKACIDGRRDYALERAAVMPDALRIDQGVRL